MSDDLLESKPSSLSSTAIRLIRDTNDNVLKLVDSVGVLKGSQEGFEKQVGRIEDQLGEQQKELQSIKKSTPPPPRPLINLTPTQSKILLGILIVIASGLGVSIPF